MLKLSTDSFFPGCSGATGGDIFAPFKTYFIAVNYAGLGLGSLKRTFAYRVEAAAAGTKYICSSLVMVSWVIAILGPAGTTFTARKRFVVQMKTTEIETETILTPNKIIWVPAGAGRSW